MRKAPFYPIVRLITAIPKKNIITLEFLYLILQKIKIEKNGNTIPQLTLPMVKEISIPVPSLDEQKQIVTQIEAEQNLINSNKQIIEIFTKKIQDRINELFKEE